MISQQFISKTAIWLTECVGSADGLGSSWLHPDIRTTELQHHVKVRAVLAGDGERLPLRNVSIKHKDITCGCLLLKMSLRQYYARQQTETL